MKSKRKLVLRTETIRALVQADLVHARGGHSDDCGDTSQAGKTCLATNLQPTTTNPA